MPGSALIRLQGCLIDADPPQVIKWPPQGGGRRYERGTLIASMPNDLLGPTPEEVQLWLKIGPGASTWPARADPGQVPGPFGVKNDRAERVAVPVAVPCVRRFGNRRVTVAWSLPFRSGEARGNDPGAVPPVTRSRRSATRTGGRSCACSATATSRSGRSPRRCPSAGPRCPGTCGCSRRPAWWPSRPRAPAGSTTCRTRGCGRSRRTWSGSGGRRPAFPAGGREHRPSARTGPMSA